MLFMQMDQNKNLTAYKPKIQHLFLAKARKMTVISSSQLTHQVHLNLVMVTVQTCKWPVPILPEIFFNGTEAAQTRPSNVDAI